MMTTADERREAVRLSRELLDTRGESEIVLLLCRTILDCHSTFQRIAPVYYAALKLTERGGPQPGSWRAFEAACRAAREFEHAAQSARESQ